MTRTALTGTLAAALLAATLGTAAAQAQQAPSPPPDQQTRPQAQKPKQERIYGSQMMTREERDEYRRQMRAAKTPEERAQLRKDHHDRMVERAKERGITLPDQPPANRPRGPGMGGGMGPGGPGGMGPGGMGPGGRGPGAPGQPPGQPPG